jgi:hypothetical protein
MILAPLLIALALQAPTPPFLQDRAFLAAHEAWAACTNRVADAEAASARSAEEIAAAALAGCAAEQEATRRAVIAFSGAEHGAEQMAVLLDGNREGLVVRVRELRRRAAGAQPPGSPPPAGSAANPFDAAIAAWIDCLNRQIEGAAADAPEAQAVDAAFGGCGAEQEALRRQGAARGGARRADEFIRRARDLNRDHLLDRLRARRRH